MGLAGKFAVGLGIGVDVIFLQKRADGPGFPLEDNDLRQSVGRDVAHNTSAYHATIFRPQAH